MHELIERCLFDWPAPALSLLPSFLRQQPQATSLPITRPPVLAPRRPRSAAHGRDPGHRAVHHPPSAGLSATPRQRQRGARWVGGGAALC